MVGRGSTRLAVAYDVDEYSLAVGYDDVAPVDVAVEQATSMEMGEAGEHAFGYLNRFQGREASGFDQLPKRLTGDERHQKCWRLGGGFLRRKFNGPPNFDQVGVADL